MEAGCRRFFVTVVGILVFLAAVTLFRDHLLPVINDPGGSIPDVNIQPK